MPGFTRRTLALLALCLLVTPTPRAAAQSDSRGVPGLWTPALATTGNGQRGFEPDLAFDQAGFLHVAFFAGPTPDLWAIFYTNNRGGGFAPARLISAGNGGQERSPDIAVGPDGHVHVIYERRDSDEVFYVGSPDLGASWSRPQSLSGSAGKAYEPAIAADANGVAHAVWTDRRWSGVQQTTYAARPQGGTWSGPSKIGGSTFERYPDIAVAGAGAGVRVYVVFQGRDRSSNLNEDFDIYLISGAGGRFSPPLNVSNDAGSWSLEPAIASDGGAELYLAWDKQVSDSHDIVFARSQDGGASWSAPVNLARRPGLAATPALAFGRGGGIARVHIAWDEDEAALYLPYEPATNEFGEYIELVGAESDSKQVGVAASDRATLVAYAYQGGGLARAATRVAGFPVRATLSVANDQAAVSSRQLPVALGELRGGPTELRYAFGRAPTDADPWRPLEASFSVSAPAGACAQTLYVQLRAPDGRVSPPYARTLVVDDAVQASVSLANPFMPGAAPRAQASTRLGPVDAGDPGFTREALLHVGVANGGECSALVRFALGDGQPFRIDNAGFSGVLPLPGPTSEGPRTVALRVEDTLGNTLVVSRSLTLDRTPPAILGGTLAVDVPAGGLPSALATLRLAGLEARDNLYPGGYWGALIASSADPTLRDDDPALVWRPARLEPAEGGAVLGGWNLLAGLITSPSDRALAGKDVQLRLKLLDGAGNLSAETLTATVRLAEDFRMPGVWVPLVAR
jgi:hypothetical protein